MGEWLTLMAEREYRGCLLHVESLGRDVGYAWAAHLPGFNLPLSRTVTVPFDDARAEAEAAVDAVCDGLVEWVATGRTAWEPSPMSDRGAFVDASVGGLTVSLMLDGAQPPGRAIRIGLGDRAPVPHTTPARTALRPAFDGEDAMHAAERTLRELAAALGAAR